MPDDIETDNLDLAQKEGRKLILAYKSVFGELGKMTAAQKLVWEDLQRRWRIHDTSFVANTHHLHSANEMVNAVTYDPIKAALTDGAKMPVLQIEQFIGATLKPVTRTKVKKDGKRT